LIQLISAAGETKLKVKRRHDGKLFNMHGNGSVTLPSVTRGRIYFTPKFVGMTSMFETITLFRHLIIFGVCMFYHITLKILK
jgi:hypothetical protein